MGSEGTTSRFEDSRAKPDRIVNVANRPAADVCFILLVEDNVPTQRLETVILEEEGYEVRAVHSGEEALQFLAKESPSLVILDADLPGIDGFATCQTIRENSGVPILMLSGRAGPEERQRGLHAGADDYMAKPFSIPDLAGVVKNLLGRGQTDAAVASPADQQPQPDRRPAGFSGVGSSYFSLSPVKLTQGNATESEGIPREGSVGQDPLGQSDSDMYEGTVQLRVTTDAKVGGLLDFVGELRQDLRFRLFRLLANQSYESMDILLGLREPMPLRTLLLDMEGVSHVEIGENPAGDKSHPLLLVVIG